MRHNGRPSALWILIVRQSCLNPWLVALINLKNIGGDNDFKTVTLDRPGIKPRSVRLLCRLAALQLRHSSIRRHALQSASDEPAAGGHVEGHLHLLLL